jgi:hypothetical protein
MLGFLAACGADGMPTAPKAQTGIVMSGEARTGVVIAN